MEKPSKQATNQHLCFIGKDLAHTPDFEIYFLTQSFISSLIIKRMYVCCFLTFMCSYDYY